MQIHEVTQRPVGEGLLGDVGRGMFKGATGIDLPNNPAKDAAAAAAKLSAQGYGPGGNALPSADWRDKYKQIGTDPAIKQYASGLAQSWMKTATSLPKAPNATQTTATPKAPPSPAGRPAPGQMPSGVAASAQGQKMMQAYGKPKGGIQDIDSDLEEAPQEYTTPGGIVVPAGTKTDRSTTSTSDPIPAQTQGNGNYGQEFVSWADQQLASSVPKTGETINMNKVRAKFPDLAEKLEQAVEQIVATKGTATHAQALQNYITLAVAGVQAEAQRSKNQYGTVQTDLGIGTKQLASLKALARTSAGKELLKKELGI
jgi:hypothetical protein